MKSITKSFLLTSTFILFNNIAIADVNFRCEHQGSQNAMQFPIDNYFFVTIEKPLSFNSYTVTVIKNNKANSVLKYNNGKTVTYDMVNKTIVETDWNAFNKNFNLYKNELNGLLSYQDKELKLIPELNIDFLSKINEANIYHSQMLTKENIQDRKANEAVFNLIGPLLDIERTTSLPGNKINHQVANKNITYNDRTGMLLQVEVKINSAFLRYVLSCKTWEPKKSDITFNTVGFKKVDGSLNQFALFENDLERHNSYFSKAIMDVMFRVAANYYYENPDSEMSIETKTKMIHALMKSKVWESFIKKELALKNNKEIQEKIKQLVFAYSQNYLTREFGGLDSKLLAKIYQDMFIVIGSYHELLIKGYK
jgi:hypothetical protein